MSVRIGRFCVAAFGGCVSIMGVFQCYLCRCVSMVGSVEADMRSQGDLGCEDVLGFGLSVERIPFVQPLMLL